jgi:hypothetical protein
LFSREDIFVQKRQFEIGIQICLSNFIMYSHIHLNVDY